MVLVSLGLFFCSISPTLADPRPDVEESRIQQERSGGGRPDFLFGRPRFSFGVRGGWTSARADSEIYDFVSEELTIEKGDFGAPLIGLDLAYRLNERLSAVFGFEYSRADIQSEFRDYVDMDDLPITQETKLSEIPVTGSIKLYLIPQGQEISRYAWVPNSIAPFVGGGGGFIWYRFDQMGDFVDFDDLSIFFDEFQSEGWGTIAHIFGGVEFKLIPRLFFTFEMRYSWADAELSGSFVGFEPIDLSGLRTSFGIEVLF
jgi:hypothetical protein